MALHERDLASVEDARPAADVDRARVMARQLAECFIAERERWPLWLPVLMGGGIGIYFWLQTEPPRWLGAALFVLAAALLAAAWRSRRGLLVPVMLLTVALGFAAAQFQAVLVAAPVLERRL